MYWLMLMTPLLLSLTNGDNIAQESQGNKRGPASDQQASGAVISSTKDRDPAESGLHGFGNGKFFMYAHSPDHKQYEFGYRRGNDYHFQERYEKGYPDHSFKTKVRWHDKYGGYGEHYWDYNHGPSYDHHDGDDHGGYHSENIETVLGQESSASEQVPAAPASAILYSPPAKRERRKTVWDLEEAQSEEKQHKSTQKKLKKKKKTEHLFTAPPQLVLDMRTGRVVDERTGKSYSLFPIVER